MSWMLVVVGVVLSLPVLLPVLFFSILFRKNDFLYFLRSIEGVLLVTAAVMIFAHLGFSFFAPQSLPVQPKPLYILFEVGLLPLLLIQIKRGIDPSPSNLENLAGKVAIVTGGSAGIGFEATRQLALLGAEVIFTGRDAKKGKRAAEKINQETRSERAHFFQVDHSNLAEVAPFVEKFKAKFDRLDILVCNVGVLVNEKVGDNGYEEGFTVMHLTHFLLTKLLISWIEQNKGRVVFVSSYGHYNAKKEDFDSFTKPLPVLTSYARGKLCNLLLCNELQRRVKDKVTCYSLHPGSTYSDIWRGVYPTPPALKKWWDPIWDWAAYIILRPTHLGATDIMICAASKECRPEEGKVKGGVYYSNFRPREPNPLALDEKFASELWAKSEEIVKPYL